MAGITRKAVGFLVLFCVIMSVVQCKPARRYRKSTTSAPTRQMKTFGFHFYGPRDWSDRDWHMPMFPKIPFFDEEEEHGTLRQRITNLENTQKRLINLLREIQAERTAPQPSSCAGEKQPVAEKLPQPVAETSVPALSSTSPATTPDIPVEVKESQTTTTTTTTTINTEVTSAPSLAVKIATMEEPREQPKETTTTAPLEEEEKSTEIPAYVRLGNDASSEESNEAEAATTAATPVQEQSFENDDPIELSNDVIMSSVSTF